MSEILISIVSLVLGVVFSFWISHYYFTRSIKKALTPFVQFSTSVFRGVDPSLKEALKIEYKNTPVTDLLEMQFLIANTGDRPIHDIIKPLTITPPETATVLDASILYVHPKGRDVVLSVIDNLIILNFDLLNANEFFILKLLLQGSARPKQFTFTISADDLPPVLKPQPLNPSLVDTNEKRELELSLLILGIILILAGSAIAILVYSHWPTITALWSQNPLAAFLDHWVLLTACIVAIFPAVLLLILGPMAAFGAFGNFRFPKARFQIPADYAKHRLFFRPRIPDFSDEL